MASWKKLLSAVGKDLEGATKFERGLMKDEFHNFFESGAADGILTKTEKGYDVVKGRSLDSLQSAFDTYKSFGQTETKEVAEGINLKELRERNKKMEDSRSVFDSDNYEDKLTFKRSSIIDDGANGPSLNTNNLKSERKQMEKEYGNAYNEMNNINPVSERWDSIFSKEGKQTRLDNQAGREKYILEKNAQDVRDNRATKILQEKKDSALRESKNFNNQQDAIKKYGKGGTGSSSGKNVLGAKMDGFLKQAIPIAVGGGLVFSMFNRGGQMSNSELYGQQNSYGY